MPPLTEGGPDSDPLAALYREVILEHYRRPRHREPLLRADARATVHNPVCGDQVCVEVRLDGDVIAEVSARTRGCSIAVASGSVMTELVRGARVERVAELRSALEALVAGTPAADDLDPRLRAFAGVAPLRSRHECARLAWQALEQALSEARNPA